MKGELGLSATDFGIAVSAFFWVYAPVQLVVGWLCDRFSVYQIDGRRHRAVGGEHPDDRALSAGSLRCWCFGSCSAWRKHRFSGHVEDYRPARPARAARHRQCRGRRRPRAWSRGGHVDRRADRRFLRLAADVHRLRPGDADLAGAVAAGRTALPTVAAGEGWRASRHASCLAMVAVGDGDRPCAGNYCFYFLLAWLPLYLVQQRGLHNRPDDPAGNARLCGAGGGGNDIWNDHRPLDPFGPVGGDHLPGHADRRPVRRRGGILGIYRTESSSACCSGCAWPGRRAHRCR